MSMYHYFDYDPCHEDYDKKPLEERVKIAKDMIEHNCPKCGCDLTVMDATCDKGNIRKYHCPRCLKYCKKTK